MCLSHSIDRQRRRGAAVVELAICLPILLIVAFATIEACAMMYLQQTLKIASYEGARVGVVPDVTAEDVRFQCESLLQDRGVQGFTVELSPSDPSQLIDDQYFHVTVSAPFSPNSVVGLSFSNRDLERSTAVRFH